MSNTTPDGTQKQHWMPKFQRELRKRLVAMRFCEVYSGPDRIIHNPYGNDPAGYDGAAATAYSITDFTLGENSMSVTRRAGAAEHVDNIEQLQTRYDLSQDRAQRHAYVAKDKIDQYVMALPVASAGVQDIDAGYMSSGVSNGTPISSSSSNIEDTGNAIIERLGLVNGALDRGITWAVSPFELTDMSGFAQNNGYNVADAAIKNGFVADTPFAGLDIVVTNNLTHTQVLGLATQVTADDTITVAGVVFTAKATPAAAGEFDIGANIDATRVIIANAINGSATGQNSASGYFEVSAADRLKLSRLQVSAVDSPSGDTITVTTRGTLITSETLTDATDAWATVKRHTIASINKSMFLALPEDGGEYEKKPVSGKHGREITTSQIYNATIWNRNLDEVIDVVMS